MGTLQHPSTLALSQFITWASPPTPPRRPLKKQPPGPRLGISGVWDPVLQGPNTVLKNNIVGLKPDVAADDLYNNGLE